MSKALRINPDISLEEILRISSGNQFDIVYNPLLQGPGNTQGGTFIKPAPIHEGSSTDYDSPDALPEEVSVRQLKEFRDSFESSQLSGDDRGMSVLEENDGNVKLVPYRAALYSEFAGNGEVVTDGGVSLDRAIDKYVQQTGDTLALPTVA